MSETLRPTPRAPHEIIVLAGKLREALSLAHFSLVSVGLVVTQEEFSNLLKYCQTCQCSPMSYGEICGIRIVEVA